MKKKLEGLVAIVTGSGQGVGKGIAQVLAREGVKVLTNNRSPKIINEAELVNLSEEEKINFYKMRGDAESAAQEINELGGEAIAFYGDVSDDETAKAMVETAINQWGRIDILVNNAAGLGSGFIHDISEEEWEKQTIPKLKGAFNLMKYAVPYMQEQKFGRIINVASDAWIGLAGLSVYSAANAGIVGLSKGAAKELYKYGITVNTICPQAASPGHILNFANAKKNIESLVGANKIDPEKLKAVEAAHATPDKAAPFVAYLCTTEAGFISGSVFTVTSDSRVSLYSEPFVKATIKKEENVWDIDELIQKVPETLLKDYVSIVQNADW